LLVVASAIPVISAWSERRRVRAERAARVVPDLHRARSRLDLLERELDEGGTLDLRRIADELNEQIERLIRCSLTRRLLAVGKLRAASASTRSGVARRPESRHDLCCMVHKAAGARAVPYVGLFPLAMDLTRRPSNSW
jgi:hypothetical protein